MLSEEEVLRRKAELKSGLETQIPPQTDYLLLLVLTIGIIVMVFTARSLTTGTQR